MATSAWIPGKPAKKENMDKAGLKVYSRFDAYDALENKQDLEQLYDVLSSVKDKHGNHAVFTPFALPCNINFEQMAEGGYKQYRYEQLPQTYEKLATKDPEAYEGAWKLWKEGIDKGIMAPQFHGREHLNLKVLEEKLAQKDYEVLTALKNRSYTSISHSGFPNINYTAAFAFEDVNDQKAFPEILDNGTKAFKDVFGYKPTVFTPPAQQFPKCLESSLKNYGLKTLDKPFFRKRHLGHGQYKREFNTTKRDKNLGLNTLVRNVVFEPTDDRGMDWVNYSLKQIETAFYWNKPAIISSHRVNFCGHIDSKNRETGLRDLRQLLQAIVRKWPDVEFMTVHQLGDLIEADK